VSVRCFGLWLASGNNCSYEEEQKKIRIKLWNEGRIQMRRMKRRRNVARKRRRW
jgi:hypothetical protein